MEEFELQGIEPTGKTLGSGSYGSVVEVKYGHIVCAAKQLHGTLLSPLDRGHEDFLKKYGRECELMARLRHPHIVQFLGVCYLTLNQTVPLLVMERLETSLHCMLDMVPDLPLSLKISWLEGVCYGLSYLHQMSPSVIHRDLSASNVLLTSFLVAKISDVGNSRIVAMSPGQIAQTLTRQPGTLVYMPPECLNESHRYGPSLDVFSFGHLSLFTFIQRFPWDLKSPTYPASSEDDGIIGRSEVERREDYISLLEDILQKFYPELVSMVKQCLHNKSEKRPSLEALLYRLKDMREKLLRVHGQESVDARDILARKDMAERETVILRLTKETKELQKSVNLKEDKLDLKEKELMQTQKKVLEYQKTLQEMTAEIEKVKEQKDQATKALNELKKLYRSSKVQKEDADSDQLNLGKPSEDVVKTRIQRLTQELEDSKILLRVVKGIEACDRPLDIDWKVGKVIPRPTGGFAHAVVIQNIVYVAGGLIHHRDVMVYHVPSEQWLKSLEYGLIQFSLASVRDQLVLVGGSNSDTPSSELSVWDANTKQWVSPYVAMPTPRLNASVATYRNYLVVAGGCSRVCRPQQHHRRHFHGGAGPASNYDNNPLFSTCEVLNTDTNLWHATAATPIPWKSMKCAIVGDVFYACGGHTTEGAATDALYYASLPALTSDSSATDSNIWRSIKVNCSILSMPVNIGGRLHLCGGVGCRSIHRYLPETEEWLVVGEMPLMLSKAAAAMTGDGNLFLAGGRHIVGRPLDLVHIGRFQ